MNLLSAHREIQAAAFHIAIASVSETEREQRLHNAFVGLSEAARKLGWKLTKPDALASDHRAILDRQGPTPIKTEETAS